MENLVFVPLKVLAFLILLSMTAKCVNAGSPPEKDVTVVVLVTWGDVDNTPAQNVYVEAHGYVVKDKAEESFVFKMVRAGRYEGSIPPGVYDIFVSDSSSEPRCKRMQVAEGRTDYWTLKLENDDVYMNH